MKNLKLGVKLIGGFVVVSIITSIAGLVGYQQLVKMAKHTDFLGNQVIPKMEHLSEMEAYLDQIMISLETLLSTHSDKEEREKVFDSIHADRVEYRKHFEVFDSLKHSDEEIRLRNKLSTEIDKWVKINNQIIKDAKHLIELDILNPEEYLKYLWMFTSDHHKLESRVGELILDNKVFEGGTDSTKCRFGKWLAGYQTTNPEISSILNQLHTPHNHFHASVAKIKSAVVNGQREDAIKIFQGEMLPAAREVFAEFDKLHQAAQKSTDVLFKMEQSLTRESKQSQQSTMGVINQLIMGNYKNSQLSVAQAVADSGTGKTIAIVGMVLGVLFGLTLGLVLTRGITKPIFKGVAFAKRMSQGDFTEQLDIYQNDEIGVLASALNDMVLKLRDTVSDVQTASNTVASGSQQLSSSSQAMSEGASEQASSIEEVSSSMEEMEANINQNTDNAVQTEKISQQAASNAEKGGDAVNQTLQAMKDIAEKISIIEDIARQTNLLALNAAIEAARAGEHGKGFAVVAAEVRKLAERSGIAAAEISDLSTSSVEIAENAGKMLEKIVPDIQKTAELIQEIAAASNEQNSGASQINKAIQQLDRVIQQNASASEEMASTSEELSSQALQLQESTSFFNIGNDNQVRSQTEKSVPTEPGQRMLPGSKSQSIDPSEEVPVHREFN